MLNEIVNVAEAYRTLKPVARSALRRTIVLAWQRSPLLLSRLCPRRGDDCTRRARDTARLPTVVAAKGALQQGSSSRLGFRVNVRAVLQQLSAHAHAAIIKGTQVQKRPSVCIYRNSRLHGAPRCLSKGSQKLVLLRRMASRRVVFDLHSSSSTVCSDDSDDEPSPIIVIELGYWCYGMGLYCIGGYALAFLILSSCIKNSLSFVVVLSLSRCRVVVGTSGTSSRFTAAHRRTTPYSYMFL